MIDSTTGRRDHWQSMLWIVNAGGQVIVLDSYFLEFQWMLPLEEKSDMERAPEETATRLAEDKLGLRLTSKQIELICTGVDRHKNPIYLFKPVVNLPEVEKLFINTPSPISHDFIARSEIKTNGYTLLSWQRDYLINVAKLIPSLRLASDNTTPLDRLKDKARGYGARPL